MWRLLTAALVVAASAGDQFCFDHSGTPTGRAITAGQSAAILPGRAMNEIFPGGTRIVPQPSTLEENNGDGKVPSACYEDGKIPVKAPYNLKLGQCRGDLSGEELLEVCLALCTREDDCQDADEEKKALTNNEDEDLDELGRPRLGKGPDASTTRLTLPGQDDPPARVDDAPPVEVPLQGSSPEGRGGCAIA